MCKNIIPVSILYYTTIYLATRLKLITLAPLDKIQIEHTRINKFTKFVLDEVTKTVIPVKILLHLTIDAQQTKETSFSIL